MDAERLRGLLNALQTANVADDAAFHNCVSMAFNLIVLSEDELARKFSVSRPSINRWKNGRSAPHPAMRKHVYAWLKRRVTLELEKNAPRTDSSSSRGFSPEPPSYSMAAKARE